MSAAMEVDHKEIDESLYSRQLYVLGHEAMKRMAASNVLLVGLKGLGVEIAKNLILGGVRSVSLMDPASVQISDLGSQFFLKESDVGKARAAACVADLADLNRNVKVEVVEQPLDAALVQSGRFQLVVLTDSPTSEQLRVNSLCRGAGVSFIAADVRGVAASCFVDLGEKFVVTDKNGEPEISKLVASITRDKPGMVTVLDESRHGLETGDWVTFEEVEGMHELNQCEPRQIRETGPFTFTIGDTSAFSEYKSGGRFRQVKPPVTVSFQSLADQLASKQPSLMDSPDMSKFDHPAQLHCLFQALGRFQDANQGRLPRADTMEDAQAVVAIAKEFAANLGAELNEATLLQLARCASASIAPITAYLGGVVGQEAMKAVSGKFMPIRQFLYYDALEALPKLDATPLAEFTPLNSYACNTPIDESMRSRYDDYIAVFGRSIHQRLCEQRFFLVGAGAIGCEMLKNWALMGLGTQGNGHITVTDMDTIEKSNLSRQFLFRNHDVGKLKSKCAGDAAARMNPHLTGRITALENRVAPETQDIFDDKFWDSLDGVCTALDNMQARLYVDQRCVYFQKPLLESGTLGTKGNTQVVIPFLTESYGSSQDPQEQSIPICTLKFYPYQIEHTIQWARDAFEGWFANAPSEINNYLTNPNYLVELAKQPNVQLETLQTLHTSMVTERPLTFDQCVQWARMRFEEEYNHKIAQLLYNFPPDALLANGGKFWSGTKRVPAPIVFDASDACHMGFVVSAANLRASNYGLQGHANVEVIKEIIGQMRIPEFKPKSSVKIAADESEMKKMSEQKPESSDEVGPMVQAITSALPAPASLAGYRVHPATFEKDDDTNFHMDFVTACSNLRARNYRIKEENKYQTKLIAGKIIPAIATTTALVAGLVVVELYKYIQKKPVEAYRSTFSNLAVPLFSFSEPNPPLFKEAPIKSGPWKWSLWDHIDIDAVGMTLQDLLDHFEEKFGLTINMLSYGSAIIYSFFGNKKELATRLQMPVADVCVRVSKTELPASARYIVLEASVNDADDNDVEIPYMRVKIAP